MNVKYFLTAYNSKPDIAGGMYWAFELTDADTGKVLVQATVGRQISDSNIYMIKYGFSDASKGWADKSIVYNHVEDMPIRRFNAMVKGWEYAGTCDLQEYVKAHLTPVEETK